MRVKIVLRPMRTGRNDDGLGLSLRRWKRGTATSRRLPRGLRPSSAASLKKSGGRRQISGRFVVTNPRANSVLTLAVPKLDWNFRLEFTYERADRGYGSPLRI